MKTITRIMAATVLFIFLTVTASGQGLPRAKKPEEVGLSSERLLGPRTVAFMTSDHLGPMGNRDDALYVPARGYGVGFDFYVRVDAGHAYFPGNVGEFYKGGAAGTIFWVDPKEDLIAVFMVSSPDYREHYRFLMKTLIYQAILR